MDAQLLGAGALRRLNCAVEGAGNDFLASVNHTGTTSMEIGVKVLAMDIRSQMQRHVNSCFFTMVAVDDDRKPVAVPPRRRLLPGENAAWHSPQPRHAGASPWRCCSFLPPRAQ
jgi:acyl-CoA hydrolase